MLIIRNVHVYSYVQKKDHSPSCRGISIFIGNKHPSGAIPNFLPFFAAVASVVVVTYGSLRPDEFFVA